MEQTGPAPGSAVSKPESAGAGITIARMLADLKDAPDVDLSLSGFDEDEVAKLLRSLNAREKRDRDESFDLDVSLLRQSGPQRRHRPALP